MKEKLIVTNQEIKEINRCMNLAKIATHPLEVKRYRMKMNAIISKVKLRNQ